MTGNLIFISIIGLVVGFILSVPVAGPTSIVITSNALKGRTRYCNLISIGASFADLVYVFISVYGLTKLYVLYKPYIPYVLLTGCLFVIYIGYNITKSKLDLEDIDESKLLTEKKYVKSDNGFVTGIMLGFLNPSLFFGWMTSSFIIFTTLATLGFNTGGLETNGRNEVMEIKNMDGNSSKAKDTISLSQIQRDEVSNQNAITEYAEPFPKNYPLLLSLCYAFFISVGSIIWFYYMSMLISKFRKQINARIVHRTIQVLGIALIVFGLFLGYKGIALLV